MANIKVQLDIKDIDLVKNLLDLLTKHFDSLPNELQESLTAISDKGINDYTGSDFMDETIKQEGEVTTSLDRTDIVKVNRILKKIWFADMSHTEAEHFWIKKGERIIYEW